MRLLPALCIFTLGSLRLSAQTLPVPDSDDVKPTPKPAPTAAASKTTSTINALQASVDRLTLNNQALLDLLKKQQAVLEDIQFDRRLQSRQIQSVAQRLEESLAENGKLQTKIAALEATAAATPPPSAIAATPAGTTPKAAPLVEPPPAEPSTYLPPEPAPMPQGTPGWHRAFTLSGTESKTTDIFNVQGGTWRVVWHNLDKPGKAYVNTSALFINAFPRDDTIPQKVCSKLGPGGDSTILIGPGHYYLKIEASGGSWELAVEDFY